MVKFEVKEMEEFSVVEFILTEGAIAPEVLKGLKAPAINATKGVILSGRGPVCLKITTSI